MGFVAGTLVHTDKGLVPIEQLKVGDMVLSKPESGQGEQAYKRVINTFKSAEKMPIVRVAFYQRDEVDYGEMYLFCTANHPFYSYDDKEWLAAIALTGNGGKIDKLVTDLHGRGLHIVNNTGYLIKISKRNVVIGRRYNYSPGTEEIDVIVDFRQNKPILVGKLGMSWFSEGNLFHSNQEIKYLPANEDADTLFYEKSIYNSIDSLGVIEPEEPDLRRAYHAYVYNIEVEDFHTYYVGQAGMLVAAQK
jgi:transcription-repair coupling factor (superfamily II helicase)